MGVAPDSYRYRLSVLFIVPLEIRSGILIPVFTVVVHNLRQIVTSLGPLAPYFNIFLSFLEKFIHT